MRRSESTEQNAEIMGIKGQETTALGRNQCSSTVRHAVPESGCCTRGEGGYFAGTVNYTSTKQSQIL